MYISYATTLEGAGAQFQRVLALLGICKVHNLKYIHKKLTIGHNYDKDSEWHDKWNDLFNIQKISHHPIYISNVLKIDQLHPSDINYISLHKDALYSIEQPFRVVDADPNLYYKAVQNDAIKAYDECNVLRPLHLYSKTRTNIAIHIRVINSHDDEHEFKNYENLKGRFEITPEHYLQLIAKLKSDYPNHNINIFTQTNIFIKYKELTDLPNVNIHIDTDAIDSFHHMCKADVLVIAKSSFSYLAGLYNKNKVLYIPFHHPPLDTWQNINDYMTP